MALEILAFVVSITPPKRIVHKILWKRLFLFLSTSTCTRSALADFEVPLQPSHSAPAVRNSHGAQLHNVYCLCEVWMCMWLQMLYMKLGRTCYYLLAIYYYSFSLILMLPKFLHVYGFELVASPRMFKSISFVINYVLGWHILEQVH